MKNDRLNGSCWLSVVGCRRTTKGLPFSCQPTLALTIALTLLVTPYLFAQQRWERNYGGAGGDLGYSVQQTSDGGYVVAGYTVSFGNGDQVYLIKTNASGDTLWTRNYGGTSYDDGNSIQQTSDGGYIVAGNTASFGNGYQVYLVKTNAFGDTLWTRTYGETQNDYGNSVQQTSDGGYIIAGWTWPFGSPDQVYIIKTNASGDTLWTMRYGRTDNYRGYSVQQTSDGGYIIVGSKSSSDSQVLLIKTNAVGDTLWIRMYGGPLEDYGYSVQQTTDGGYIVAGYTFSFGNGGQVYLIKTNAGGDTLWTRTYGGASMDRGYSVQQTSDGGYIVAGITSSFGNLTQVYLIKTNTSGDTLWTRTYGGAGWEEGRSVQQTSDGGYIVAGVYDYLGTDPQVYLVKTDANGNVGTETERGQGFEGSRVQGFKITPNPFITFATVPGHTSDRFSLYDIAGRKVGTYRGDRVGEGLAPGVYFVCEGTACRAPTRIVKVR